MPADARPAAHKAVLAKSATYFSQPVLIVCDGNCRKAWGINSRPRVRLSDDADDYAFLADDELGEAPADPGTYEGPDGKPTDYDDPDRQNKWCARECERSQIVDWKGASDLAKRLYNIPSSEAKYEQSR